MLKTKNFIINLYYEHGRDLGIQLLKNCGISALIFVALFIITSTKITFVLVMETILALPIISVFVWIVRAVIGLFHKIVPMQPGGEKIIIDFIIFLVIIVALGFFLGDAPMPKTELTENIIMVAFDLVYVALTVFLLKADSNEVSKSTTEK